MATQYQPSGCLDNVDFVYVTVLDESNDWEGALEYVEMVHRNISSRPNFSYHLVVYYPTGYPIDSDLNNTRLTTWIPLPKFLCLNAVLLMIHAMDVVFPTPELYVWIPMTNLMSGFDCVPFKSLHTSIDNVDLDVQMIDKCIITDCHELRRKYITH